MADDPRDALVVALDVGGLDAAREMVDRLGERIRWFKVGLELYSAAGPAAIAMLKEREKRIFLDLKLHDIPNTVSRAAIRLAELGVDIIDLHTVVGAEAMAQTARAVKEARPGPERPVLLGVTVLTSTAGLSPDELVSEAVRRASEAQEAGLDGVVAPAPAAPHIRRQCGDGFSLLVPGIRPEGSARGDQRWIASPAAARAAGARWLVVGRPITGAPDPAAAATAILTEIEAADPSASRGV